MDVDVDLDLDEEHRLGALRWKVDTGGLTSAEAGELARLLLELSPR
ncbi:MAG: hypothetical protein JWO68_3804 [Actinomycetia bacterium]|jgi:hypothetical protein|nr:hypothetical protein [Actinomycetes bacterium]